MGGDFFSFDVSETPQVHFFALRGELDVANAEQLQRALSGSQAPGIVVDLSGLTFIDSSGLTALVHAHREITARAGTFELRGARNGVKRVFEIAGLTRLLAAG